MSATTLNRNSPIGTSTFTLGWLLDSLQRHDEVYQTRHASKIATKVTSNNVAEGKGISGKVYRITLHFGDTSSYSTILKVPGSDKLMAITENTEGGVNDICAQWDAYNETSHAFECKFMTELAPKLDIPMPKAFSTQLWSRAKNIQGCIHMSDLTDLGTTTGLWMSVTLGQVNTVLRHLVKMHADVLCLDRSSWEGQYVKNQTAMSIMCSNYLVDVERVRKMDFCKERVNHLLDRVGTLPSNKKFVDWAHTDVYKNLKMRPVIAFGDLHSNNLLWAYNAHGDTTDTVAGFIDFQLVHEGSPMNDLSRFLSLSADGIIRRKAEETIFTDYHKLLSAELESVGIEMPYTVKDLKTAYEYMFIAQAPQWVTINGSFMGSLAESEPACVDVARLRMIHCLEDVAGLLEGEYKHLKEQFST
uniref:CHK domain-containing protein n=1 Tax=Panagrellus redivivus TaxID=6233 RepID=A0A7E4UPE9_PANRE